MSLLLAPWLAIGLTDEMDWDAVDVATFAVLIAAACSAFELAVRLTIRRSYRLIAAVAIVVVFLLVWAQLAVGIVGN